MFCFLGERGEIFLKYYTQAEMCATIFLLAVLFRFFTIRQFPDRKTRLFGIILLCAVADLFLDIVGSYMITAPSNYPIWLNYLVNTVFYSLQVIFPALVMTYLLYMAGVGRVIRWKYVWLYLPAALFELLLLLNPLTGQLFRIEAVDGILTYLHTPQFKLLYASSAFYLVVVVVGLIRIRKMIKRDQYIVIMSFIGIIVAAVVLQYLFPEYLLTGVAIALAITMMFFTMQNPENMLDMVSGVFNYEAMTEYLKAQLTENRPFRIISLDVGGISRINSTQGMNVGNDVLSQVGAFLISEAGRGTWVFRMMGTRFVFITPVEDYSDTIYHIEERFKGTWSADHHQFFLFVKIRHFPHWRNYASVQEIINLVDLAHTQYAGPGWPTTMACSAELLDKARREIQVEEAIRRALDMREGFFLCYQPLFSVSEQRFVSAEALLRLEDPDLGMIYPGEFIEVAERTGLIYRIDHIVVEMACDFLRRQTELEELGFRFLEVNFSAAEFGRDVSELEHHVLGQEGILPEKLCFEVTETATLESEDVLCDFMERMKEKGYRFALDDFGTGNANIMRLAELPFDTVKMDRTLLTASNEKEMIVFEDLINMFKRAGLTTVVEGVETHEQYERVSVLGADIIQGFLFSHPLREPELMEHLRVKARENSN